MPGKYSKEEVIKFKNMLESAVTYGIPGMFENVVVRSRVDQCNTKVEIVFSFLITDLLAAETNFINDDVQDAKALTRS